jgi:hypothetical protein
MTVRNYTIGDGMTEKPSMSFDGVDDLELPEVKAAIETGTLDGLLRSLELECFAIMESVGLPTFHGSYAYRSTGEWHRIDRDHTFPSWGLANEIWPIARARGFTAHSVVGFASARLGNVRALRLARQRGDHDYAIQMGFYLGVQQAELRLKLAHEKVWNTGKKQTDTLTDQREKANTARQREREVEWTRWNAEADSIRRDKPGFSSRSAIAAMVIKRLGLSESVNTVRARLKKVDEAG